MGLIGIGGNPDAHCFRAACRPIESDPSQGIRRKGLGGLVRIGYFNRCTGYPVSCCIDHCDHIFLGQVHILVHTDIGGNAVIVAVFQQLDTVHPAQGYREIAVGKRTDGGIHQAHRRTSKQCTRYDITD